MNTLEHILLSLTRHRRLLWVTTALLLLALSILVSTGHYTNDIQLLFPNRSLSGRMYRISQGSRLTEIIQMELDTGTPDGVLSRSAEIHRLAEKLTRSPLVRNVRYQATASPNDAMRDILLAVPSTQEATILENADPKRAVQNTLRMLSLPGIPADTLRMDPFGFRLKPLLDLNQFRILAGYRTNSSHNFLTDPDARRILFVITPHFKAAPGATQIAEVLDIITGTAKDILPGCKITLASPLLHNLDNERIVRKDIRNVSIISAILLLILFAIVYRRSLDAIWLPLLPFAASTMAAGILAICFREVSLLVLGIGGGLAGLAVDQEIHVYASCQGESRLRQVAGIASPLTWSVLTSAAVFLMLGSTGITAYLQIGIFAALTLLFNLLLALFILPGAMRHRQPLQIAAASYTPGRKSALAILLTWAILTGCSLYLMPRLSINTALSAIDGVSPQTLADEAAMMERWRSPDAGRIVAVTGTTRDELLSTLEQAMAALERILPSDNPQSPSLFAVSRFWPSSERRKANRSSWQERTNLLRQKTEELRREATAVGLPPNFFQPFEEIMKQSLQEADQDKPPQLQTDILESLVTEGNSGASSLIFIPKDAPSTQDVLAALAPFHNTALLSEDAFRAATADELRPRIRRLTMLVLPTLLLMLLFVTRRPLELLLILLPGATAFCWCAGLAAAIGFQPNLVSLFSLVMLTGLVLDYGIFALHAVKTPGTQTPLALLLSGLTTILTTAALGTSSHPVLFHTGITLALGILFTSITALLLIPAIHTLASGKASMPRGMGLMLILLATLLFTGCASLKPEAFPARSISPTQAKEEIAAFHQRFQGTAAYSGTMEIYWHSIPFMLIVKNESAGRAIFATTLNGISFYTAICPKDAPPEINISSAVPEQGRKYIFNTFHEDIACIFPTPTPPQVDSPSEEMTSPVETREGETISLYAGTPLRLIFRRQGVFPSRVWQTCYGEWDEKTGTFRLLQYRNFNRNFTLRLFKAQQ